MLNTALAVTSITIQLKMLYPWHEEISEEIHALQKQQDQLQAKIGTLHEALLANKSTEK